MLFCPRWLFLYPGLFLTVVGLGGFAALAAGPLQMANFGLDIHSMLYMSAAFILGTQLIQLAFVTKWLGVLSGVVPSPRWLSIARRWASLELGLVAGFALFVAGLAVSLALVFEWQATGFGALDPRQMMRWAIPAVTLMIVGMQLAAGALFSGALHACWKSRGNG